VLYVDFKKENMWTRGHFQNQLENSTYIKNPWELSSNKNAPFDQNFFLIMNVAVGSRNGWFADGVGGKPWVDANPSAPLEFYNAQSKWLSSWGQGDNSGMTVKRVRMWQEGKCRS